MHRVVLTAALLAACSPKPTTNAQEPEPAVAAAGPGAAIPSKPRQVRCLIKSSEGVELDGPCLLVSEEGGSFSLDPVKGEQLVPNVMSVSLTVTAPGEGHVRGLTTDGINSMWGDVKRSASDPFCWAGSDLEICVREL